jgi:hypothetical protein
VNSVERVTNMGEKRNAFKILVRNPGRKRQLESPCA